MDGEAAAGVKHCQAVYSTVCNVGCEQDVALPVTLSNMQMLLC